MTDNLQNIINKFKKSLFPKKCPCWDLGVLISGYPIIHMELPLHECSTSKLGVPQQRRQDPHPVELPCEWREVVHKCQAQTVIWVEVYRR